MCVCMYGRSLTVKEVVYRLTDVNRVVLIKSNNVTVDLAHWPAVTQQLDAQRKMERSEQHNPVNKLF